MAFRWKQPARWGSVLLGVWLIAFGALQFVTFQYSGLLLAVLAVVAGLLILLER
jgi:hypothetical protein